MEAGAFIMRKELSKQYQSVLVFSIGIGCYEIIPLVVRLHTVLFLASESERMDSCAVLATGTLKCTM